MSRRTTRTAASFGVAVASLTVGIVGARAVQGDDPATTPPVADGAPVLADPADAAVTVDATAAAAMDDLIPVLAPVAIGNDPAIAETLLFPPDDGAGTDEDGNPAIPAGSPGLGEPLIDGAIPPPEGIDSSGAPTGAVPISDDEATPPGSGGGGETPILGDPPLAPTPFWLAGDGSRFPWPIRFVDPCAGAEARPPEMLPPPYCPDGVGGTVTGEGARTPFNAWISIPHSLDSPDRPHVVGCPATTQRAGDGEQAAAVVSTGPIRTATVYWRPRGSSAAWEQRRFDEAMLTAQGAEFEARTAAGVITAESYGIIVHCITFARDLNRPYESYAAGVDGNGRAFTTAVVTLPDLTPEGRPPSVVKINSRTNEATISSWTTPDGSVEFAWYPLAAGEEPTGNDCVARRDFPMTLGTTGPPMPDGVWDRAYRIGKTATFEMPAGGGGVVCATIYDTDNTLRPLATDVFAVYGPRRQVATIDLMGVRLNDGERLESGNLFVAAKYDAEYVPDDGCSAGWVNGGEPLTSPGAVTGDAVLWNCAYTPLPIDDRGYVKVPITVTRRVPAGSSPEYRRSTVGIPLQFDDCTTGVCLERPNEYYEVAIPTANMSLRGCVFDCDGPPPTAGAAIVRVSYAVVGSGTVGSSTLLASSDRGPDPVGSRPGLTIDERTRFLPTEGYRFSELRAEYTTFSDRPITIVSGRVVPDLAPESRCAEEREVEVISGEGTEQRWAVTLACPATAYSVYLTVRDAAGEEFELLVAYDRTPMVVGRNVTTTVEFLGDTAGHSSGLLYRFDVGIDASFATWPRNAWTWTNLDTTYPRYLCVAHGRTVARVARPIGELYVMHPETLNIGMTANFTTVCDGSGSARNAIGEVSMGGSFDLESLDATTPLIITSPADARLQVRITVTASSWQLSE